MYSVKVEGDFSSAHNLREYKGKCESLHGHNWKVELVVVKEALDPTGMVVDFKYLREKLHTVLDALDHQYLNNLPYFKNVNPTSENIAKYIFDQVTSAGVPVKSLTVWENISASATYEP
ncbi:MAG: 6-carboxytetrahydropterin synthase QueD [Candidatus Omnitrophica bacterium]|nr:6-carboxytetrahydropterin synthase QueD [Candidatus Omnitrophota bacterium]